jgi:hypothetical protein
VRASKVSTLVLQAMVFTSAVVRVDSQGVGVDEAIVCTVAKDHMVQDTDAEELSGLTQAFRQFDVL